MNNSKILLTALLLSLASPLVAAPPAPFVVEPPPNAAYPDYGPGNPSAARLRRAPGRMFTFDRAALRDVLRYLADDAGIPYIGIPENNSANSRLITFTMEASPFVALESVCRDNGVRLSYENGVWYMRTVDEERERRIQEEENNKLVGVAYRLQYDPVDRVDFRDDAATQAASDTNGTAAANPNLPLQNSQKVFTSRAPRIVNEIRTMLGLPPISFGPDGSVVGEVAPALSTVASTVESAAAPSGTSGAAPAPERLNPTYVPPQTPQVIYNTDTNLLWVVATRSQHKWVADYLMQVDQPQDLIAIEVKFFETTKDPRKELGINWAGTMQGGFEVSATDIRVAPAGDIRLNSTAQERAQSGTVPPGDATYDYFTGDRLTTLTAAAPYSAVLSTGDVIMAIQAFMSDDKTSLVQYPRVLTVNNREVAITTAENTPINTGVSTVQTDGSSTTPVGTLGYIPVGTQINILPKAIGKDEVALTVAITVSTIVRFVQVDLGISTANNLYPVTSERIFNSSLQVPSGYTLAVGGLEAVDDSKASNGIPFLQDLPGVGQLFKSKQQERNKKNLIIFITPTLIANKKATRGISEIPEAVVPIRPNDPTPPAFTPDGHLVGGQSALNAAFAWFDFQAKWFKQINRENRTDKETIKQLRAVISSLRMVIADIQTMIDNADAQRAARLQRDEERAMAILTDLNKILAYAQDNVM